MRRFLVVYYSGVLERQTSQIVDADDAEEAWDKIQSEEIRYMDGYQSYAISIQELS